LFKCLQEEAKRLAEEIAKREPYVTVLFNNAGITGANLKLPSTPTAEAYRSAVFDQINPEEVNNILNTNAVGPFWLTFAFLPLLENWKNSQEPVTKKLVPQIIMTSSMNGWTKVRSFLPSKLMELSKPCIFRIPLLVENRFHTCFPKVRLDMLLRP